MVVNHSCRSILSLPPKRQPPMIQLPILNIGDRSRGNSKCLVDAAVTYGFLYVSPEGTHFTRNLIESQFALSKEFFSQPATEKEHYHVGTDNRGWVGMHNEILDPGKQSKEFKEAFNIGEFDAQGMPQQEMPAFLSTETSLNQLRTFEDVCRQTCNQILDLVGIGLEVEGGDDWFSRRHGKPSGCTTRLLHYPSLPAEVGLSLEEDVRAGAHSDYGSITLLFQRPGQPGLQIRPPGNSDAWSPVPVFPEGYPAAEIPPILVNIGDLMSYWTNGLLRSTVHRVIFPKDTGANKDRYSIAFFCHPLDDAELVAVPSKIVQEYRRKLGNENGEGPESEQYHGHGGGMTDKRALTAKEHLLKRLAATYSHRVEKAG